MLRPRILTGLIVAVVAGVFASQVASCTLDQVGTTEVEKGAPCATDINCDDSNPCTTDVCPAATLVCEYTSQASGPAPATAQKPADCKSIVCNAGAFSEIEDLQDFINDNNSCTTDSCTNGAPLNETKPDGSACNQGVKMGTCEKGTCTITCMNNNDCDDGNPCSEDLCNTSASVCVYTNMDGVPTPGVTPIVGDCKLHICNNGLDTEINDDADVKDDMNPCTSDVCTAGVPSNPPVPASTRCVSGNDDVCDGQGGCVDCVVADDCTSITETECEKRSCVNNTCQIAYEGTGTLASSVLQTPNDCQKVVCNGNMGTTSLPDDADLPNDNNLCTTDTCSNGTPVFTDKAQGTSCGTNQVCNATGDCVGCNSPNDCAGTDSFCQIRTCVNNVCGVMNTPNGTDLPMADQTAGDCKVRECNGTGGVKTSVQQSDVPVDGDQCTLDNCNAQGTPSNPDAPLNTACNMGGGDICDGNGNCEKSLGKPCTTGGECVSNNCVDGVCCNNGCTTLCRACNVPTKEGTCSDVPDGQDDGTCTGPTQSCNGPNDCDDENGQSCTTADACLSNFCVDGVCCNNACDTACKSCAVMPGTCSNLPAMSQDMAPTNLCVGMNQCDGNGVCKEILGSPCTTAAECLSGICVDTVCCNDACGDTCESCNVSGSPGTCTLVPTGQDDTNGTMMCSGTAVSCDGAGGCKKELGTGCGVGTECFSGFCTDGVCCDAACGETCKNCNSSGMCVNVTSGQDDTTAAMMCSGAMVSCDGNGNCKKENGQACNNDGTECLSGNCADGVCCNSACTEACKACNQGGSMGTCSNLPPFTDDTNAMMPCTGANTCAAGGVCKEKNGQNCMMGVECASGACADTVCCENSCTTACKSCNISGSEGTCSNVPAMTTDGTCSGNMICNAAGMCLDAPGQPCMADGECASNQCLGNMTCQ